MPLVYGLDGAGDSYLNTQHEVLRSRGLLEKVVQNLNLINEPEFNAELREKPWYQGLGDWRSWFGFELPQEALPQEVILSRTVDRFAENVRIEPVRKTQIVKIHVMSENPALAAKAANAMGEGYIESWLEAKLSLTTNATSWMQDRLTGLSEQLSAAENQLHEFRLRENLVDMEGVLTLSSNELNALTESLVQVRRKLTLTENIYLQIKNSKANSVDDYQSLPAVLSHPLIQKLKENQAQAQQKVKELGRRYGPLHPKMIATHTELDSIEANIRFHVEQIVSGVEKEYEVAKANEQSLQKAVDEARRSVQAIKRNAIILWVLPKTLFSATKEQPLYYDLFLVLQGMPFLLATAS